jgi:hypothetical protein
MIRIAGTVLLAAIIIWQIGRQAQYATLRNKHNEAQKLKLNEISLVEFRNSFNVDLGISSLLRPIEQDSDPYRCRDRTWAFSHQLRWVTASNDKEPHRPGGTLLTRSNRLTSDDEEVLVGQLEVFAELRELHGCLCT